MVECKNCGSGEVAKAVVSLNLSSSNPEDIKFITWNKPVIVVCRKCGNVAWEVEGV